MILHGFDDIEHIKKEYDIVDADLEGYEILFACYETGCYDGSSIVILKKDDNLYIVDAGHCSCHGLEGQFYPIETTVELLKKEAECKKIFPEEYIKFIEFVETLDIEKAQGD